MIQRKKEFIIGKKNQEDRIPSNFFYKNVIKMKIKSNLDEAFNISMHMPDV
jgi:hypothetical protein